MDAWRDRAHRAVLFDFDGVVADTEDAHFRTFAGTLAEIDIHVSREEHARDYMGIDDRGCFEIAHRKARRGDLRDPLAASLLRRKSELYDESLSKIRLFDGIVEILEEAKRRGPFTIASCGRRRDIEAVLDHHGILSNLPPFISADEITRPKPHPDCFLAGLDLLRREFDTSLTPDDCLVFEDSVRGVEAAKAAGMTCVALTHSFEADRLSAADLVLHSWSEWNWPD